MLVLRDPANEGNDKVLSCCKLKTIEYKVVKKIKDKLKSFWAQYENESYITGKMKKEYKTKLDRFKTEISDMYKLLKRSIKDQEDNAHLTQVKFELVQFAQTAFQQVMYDIKLYNVMKADFNEFCKQIAKVLGKSPDEFDSKILKKTDLN